MDLFEVSDVRKTAVDVVVDKIKELLIHKKLKPGDLIPSETALAESLRVSRGSIREAMKILSAYGIIEVKRGSGTYISNYANPKLFDPLLFNILVTEYHYADLLKVRDALEQSIIKDVISQASQKELQELNTIMQEFEKVHQNNPDNLEQCNTIDIMYHTKLGEFTHNALMSNMYNFIIELFSPTINAKEGYHAHKNLHAAIMSRNVPEALTMLELHTQTWNETHRTV